jgi:hypothetical protein
MEMKSLIWIFFWIYLGVPIFDGIEAIASYKVVCKVHSTSNQEISPKFRVALQERTKTYESF